MDLSPEDDFIDLGDNIVPIDTQGRAHDTENVLTRAMIAGSLVRIAKPLCNYPYGPNSAVALPHAEIERLVLP